MILYTENLSHKHKRHLLRPLKAQKDMSSSYLEMKSVIKEISNIPPVCPLVWLAWCKTFNRQLLKNI